MSKLPHFSRATGPLDPRKWSLAGQIAFTSGLLVGTILALLAWRVIAGAEPTVVEKAGGTFQATANGLNDVLLLYIGDRVRELQAVSQSNPVYEQIQAENAGHAGSVAAIVAEIQSLDREWVAATDGHPLIVQVTSPASNPAAGELSDFLATFPEHSEVFVTDRHGATVAATGRLSDYYQADEEWWQAAWNRGEGGLSLSQPVYDESAGVLAILVASAIVDDEGQPIGVARSTLAVSRLFELVGDAAALRAYEVLVLGPTGLSLYDRAAPGQPDSTPAAHLNLLEELRSAAEGYGQSEDIGGIPTIFGYAELHADSRDPEALFGDELTAAVNQLGWTTVVYREREALLEPVAEFGRLMVWVTAGSILAFGLASFAVSRTITAPLRKLTAAARRITAGELGIRVPVRGSRELTQLSEAFNHMSQQVEYSLHVMRSEVDDRKAAEQAARGSEARLRSTLDSMMEGAQIIGPDWRYQYVNDAAAVQGRQTKETLLGRTMMEMYPGIERTEMFGALERCMEHAEPTVMQNEFTFPDGAVGWFDLRIQRVPEGVFILSSDVTQRKLAEDELLRLNQELEQRVRERTAQLEAANQELEAFAYSVSHDLRAPLRSIDGFTLALVEDFAEQLNEQALGYAKRVRAAAQRMGLLIDDLLKLSRVTRAEMTRGAVDLSALAEQTVESLRQLEPNRSVEVSVEKGLVGRGDQRLLEVMFENLLENAWKFTAHQPNAAIEFGHTNANGAPVYFVRDNGAGFDMQYAGKLFGAFQRLHSVHEFPGTGVGLATVQRIVRRHGGRIWAEAEVGKGATFYFTLLGDPQGSAD